MCQPDITPVALTDTARNPTALPALHSRLACLHPPTTRRLQWSITQPAASLFRRPVSPAAFKRTRSSAPGNDDLSQSQLPPSLPTPPCLPAKRRRFVGARPSPQSREDASGSASCAARLEPTPLLEL